MGAPPDIRFGILKCRDLVELYYGARMVTFVREQVFQKGVTTNATLIMQPDPRRIAYEIELNAGLGGQYDLLLSTSPDPTLSNSSEYLSGAPQPFVIQRSFLTYFDAVCLPIYMLVLNSNVAASVREILLSTIPVDEIP